VGEGPASFTDYFSQQDRWSRGTDEVLLRRFWRIAHRLGPRALMHYLLLTCYYPTAAIAWILGAVNAILYFTMGAGGVVVEAHVWLMLYVDAAALQVGLYFFNRRHNVSPHEKKGSAGVAGMLISALSAPIYAASLAAVTMRRSSGFVTTPKGDARTRDTLITFRKHILWALVFGVPLLLSFVLGHQHASMRAWTFASLVVCLLPVAIWRLESRGQEQEAPEEQPEPVKHLRAVPDLPIERRKRHETVRFERRAPAAHARRERKRHEPVRELAPGRRKDHVVVRFAPARDTNEPEGERELAWQMFGEAER
jgi:cellulose synthase/poly-beta-1,6-N-acetylglucosamine synthase-like glycosyltransferase